MPKQRQAGKGLGGPKVKKRRNSAVRILLVVGFQRCNEPLLWIGAILYFYCNNTRRERFFREGRGIWFPPLTSTTTLLLQTPTA